MTAYRLMLNEIYSHDVPVSHDGIERSIVAPSILEAMTSADEAMRAESCRAYRLYDSAGDSVAFGARWCTSHSSLSPVRAIAEVTNA